MNQDRPTAPTPGSGSGRPFLGIHFVNCGTYGRIYKNKEGNAYVGHCPKCMHALRVRIGPEGTGTRFFKCFCP